MTKISIIIPSYNSPENLLEKLYYSFLNQKLKDFEVIIVDDNSTFNHYEIIKDNRFKIIYKDKNSGPAESRNIGAKSANSDILFFTDSDCEIDSNALEKIIQNIENENILMGNTITKAKTFLGKAIAYMGFPGGGIIGFDKVWKVDKEGYTNSISSCNVAIKKNAFKKLGGFDISFPVPGGEDTVFAKQAIKNDYKIKYIPEQIVYHIEKTSLKSFVNWQITRGKGNYHIKRKLGSVKNFLKLRLWSFKNSIINAGLFYGFVVIFLIGTSVICQMLGYKIEERKNK